MERVTETYDTRLPADSLTGHPPLLRRTTERRARQTKEEGKNERTEREAAAIAEADSVEAVSATHAATAAESSEAEASREKRKSNAGNAVATILGWLFIAAFAGVLLLTAARWILNRLKNN